MPGASAIFPTVFVDNIEEAKGTRGCLFSFLNKKALLFHSFYVILYNKKKKIQIEVKALHILAIGNSYSQDATRYLAQIAAAGRESAKVVNLYIPGCSLERHIQNLINEEAAYGYELDGEKTGRMVSIQEAIASDTWDVVTMQQVSHQSIEYATYQPHLGLLSAYVKKNAPAARQVLHQTWGYAPESETILSLGFKTPPEMFAKTKAAYEEAAAETGIELVIPAGHALCKAYEEGLPPLYRDDIHASLGLGRYIIAGTWYEMLFNKDLRENPFSETDEPIEKAIREKAAEIVHTATRAYK